jgi:hypothetical protein
VFFDIHRLESTFESRIEVQARRKGGCARYSFLINWPVAILAMVSLLFVSAASAQNPTSSQNLVPSFALSITTAQPTVKAGSTILVDVTMENKSDHDLEFTFDTMFPWDMEVWDEKGVAAPETPHARHLRGHKTATDQAGPSYTFTSKILHSRLNRKESFTNRVNICDMYELGRAGKYTIQFRRYDEESKSAVTSNKITVIVTPYSPDDFLRLQN